MGPKVADAEDAKKKASRAKGNQQPVSFGAYPDEIARWKKAAGDCPLSKWIRRRLLAADARDEQEATRFVNSPSTASDERQ
jgi:hypothetical protein